VNESDSPSGGVHHGYLRKVVACFLVLLSLWGAGDVLMAAASKQAPALVTPVEFVEGLGMAMRRGFQYESTYVNSDGFRRAELPPIASGEIRILALGDSVTFGTNLANGEDWPSMVEKQLRARGVPATVMNAGNPGTRTNYMFGALKYYTARMKVDLVLVHNTGNMLALYSMDDSFTPHEIAERLFPDEGRGSLRARPQCPDASVVQAPSAQAVSLPAIIKRLTAHSPAIADVVSRLKDRPANPPPSANGSVSDACFSPASRAGYMVRDMLAMGQMIEYAKRERVPLFFVRPTYVFNWAGADARLKSPPTYREFKGSWTVIERVDRMFDFFEQKGGAGFVDPVSRLRRERGNSALDVDVTSLYLDYTHFSPEGSRLVSKAMADELIERKVVAPVTSGPWKHPAESPSSRDLRYQDIPRSLSLVNAMGAGVLVSFVTFVAGLALQLLIPGYAQRYLAAASMFGYFVVAAAGIVASNFSLDAYTLSLGVAAAATILVSAAWRRFPVRRAALLALASGGLSVASAALIFLFLHYAVWKDPRHVQYIRTEVAWAEYLVPENDRVLQMDLVRRQLADGIARPHMIPNVVSAHSQVVQPASPDMAVYMTRVAGPPVQDAVIGVWAAFCGAIATLALATTWALRRRRILAGVVAALGVAVFLFTTLCLPSPLTMALAAALSVICVAMYGKDAAGREVRWGLLFAAGAMAYLLPARAFLAFVAILMVLAGVKAFWQSKSLRESAKQCLIVAVLLLAARALLFDLTVVDARLYRLLGVNQLEFVPFFL
jgi:lysophospholipase L1-like esterase